MLPLLFVCTSQHRPLRVRNPIRCNRRILSQPCFYRSYSPRYPFGAPLRSHLLYLSVPFLSALRNVLCKTSMINTLFLIAFTYSYSSTGNPDCQCSFVSLLMHTRLLREAIPFFLFLKSTAAVFMQFFKGDINALLCLCCLEYFLRAL